MSKIKVVRYDVFLYSVEVNFNVNHLKFFKNQPYILYTGLQKILNTNAIVLLNFQRKSRVLKINRANIMAL